MKFRRSPLRWPGSKFEHLHELFKCLPQSFNNYFEPFSGSGVVFYNLNFHGQAYLSDLNPELITFYKVLIEHTKELFHLICSKENSEQFYYLERSQKPKTDIELAARFYYLNRTCFNGLYRINKKGQFNVPYGNRTNLNVLDKENLISFKKKLKNAKFSCHDFEKTKIKPNKYDFIFIDPPYSSKIDYENFTMYNDKVFSWKDQQRLANYCKELDSKGVKIMMTNLYNDEIKVMFHDELNFKMKEIIKFSRVAGQQNNRKLKKEYLFINY